MNCECVVTIRMDNGDNLLAILAHEHEGIITVEHPYFIKVDDANIIMTPYCALSDEVFFEFNKEKIQFMVTANSNISDKFLKMVDALEHISYVKTIEEDASYDQLITSLAGKVISEGTDTKH